MAHCMATMLVHMHCSMVNVPPPAHGSPYGLSCLRRTILFDMPVYVNCSSNRSRFRLGLLCAWLGLGLGLGLGLESGSGSGLVALSLWLALRLVGQRMSQ